MNIDDTTQDGILIVTPAGKLDTTNAPHFLTRTKELLSEKPKACLIDLEQITFLASSGLQSILATAKLCKKESMHFGVCGMQEMSYNVFTMSGFNQFIQCFDTKEEALENLL